MNAETLLENIRNATQPEDIFSRSNYKKEYIACIKLLHPDVCSLSGATEAVEKLNAYKKHMESLHTVEDDAGTMHIVDSQTITVKGDRDLLQKSLEKYNRLMSLTDESSGHFKRYLPLSMDWEADYLRIKTTHRAVPLTHLPLTQEHASWVLNRIFEFTTWLHQVGYCHMGINPESVWVVPETHGIVCVSFYHLQYRNNPLKTISGRYVDWYPQLVFDQKKAIPYADLSLAQRTVLFALGDKSGNGVKLKKVCDERLIDFLITPHYDSYAAYDEYRKLLRDIFGKPKFHELKV